MRRCYVAFLTREHAARGREARAAAKVEAERKERKAVMDRASRLRRKATWEAKQ